MKKLNLAAIAVASAVGAGCAARTVVCKCEPPATEQIEWPRTTNGNLRAIVNIYAVTIPPEYYKLDISSGTIW